MVLLQKQDERLVLKFHGKNPASAADTKHIFSPVIKLNTVLVRPVATGKTGWFQLSFLISISFSANLFCLVNQTVFTRGAGGMVQQISIGPTVWFSHEHLFQEESYVELCKEQVTTVYTQM